MPRQMFGVRVCFQSMWREIMFSSKIVAYEIFKWNKIQYSTESALIRLVSIIFTCGERNIFFS